MCIFNNKMTNLHTVCPHSLIPALQKARRKEVFRQVIRALGSMKISDQSSIVLRRLCLHFRNLKLQFRVVRPIRQIPDLLLFRKTFLKKPALKQQAVFPKQIGRAQHCRLSRQILFEIRIFQCKTSHFLFCRRESLK